MSKRTEERALEAYPEKWWRDCDGDAWDSNEKRREGFIQGYEQAEKDLGWHSVEESLPPMDEEVIVLSNIVNGQYISSARRISFGHIVNKEICVDYDGWNIPGVKYWMPCPKLEELK